MFHSKLSHNIEQFIVCNRKAANKLIVQAHSSNIYTSKVIHRERFEKKKLTS